MATLLALPALGGEHVDLADVRPRDDLRGARTERHRPRVHRAILHGTDLQKLGISKSEC